LPGVSLLVIFLFEKSFLAEAETQHYIISSFGWHSDLPVHLEYRIIGAWAV